MTEQEYLDMPVKFPIEPTAKVAVHIDSPAKCFDCKSQNKNKPIDYDKLRDNSYHRNMTS